MEFVGELHGILNYVVEPNAAGRLYRVYGYGGKQVRDNIQACDVAAFMYEFSPAPRIAEFCKQGGGKNISCSIMEAFQMAEQITGNLMQWEYVEDCRIGDHIYHFSNLKRCAPTTLAGISRIPCRPLSPRLSTFGCGMISVPEMRNFPRGPALSAADTLRGSVHHPVMRLERIEVCINRR